MPGWRTRTSASPSCAKRTLSFSFPSTVMSLKAHSAPPSLRAAHTSEERPVPSRRSTRYPSQTSPGFNSVNMSGPPEHPANRGRVHREGGHVRGAIGVLV
jgi:hypothetical protein